MVVGKGGLEIVETKGQDLKVSDVIVVNED